MISCSALLVCLRETSGPHQYICKWTNNDRMPALERQWSPDHRRLSRWQGGNTNQIDRAVLEKEFNQANIESLCVTEHIDLGHFHLSCPLRIKARPHRLFFASNFGRQQQMRFRKSERVPPTQVTGAVFVVEAAISIRTNEPMNLDGKEFSEPQAVLLTAEAPLPPADRCS